MAVWVGCQVSGPVTLNGSQQSIPAPDGFGMVECHWTEPFRLQIPADWVSGVYLAKLSTMESPLVQRYIIFVVTDDLRPSPYLFQTSVTTYEAYNPWGGRSLYTGGADGTVRAHKVSFNRPYDGNGAGHFFEREIRMVRWLEREGYDVTYVTNIDTHQKPDLLLSHKAFLSVGHDEYWSWQMRSNVERALHHGVSLGFLTANAAYWQIRLESSGGQEDRTMVGYKECALVADPRCTTAEDQTQRDPYAVDSDPVNDRLVTTRWRDFPVSRPEERLLRLQYETYESDGIGDIRITTPSHWLYQGTGLQQGDLLVGLLGPEVDALHNHAPAGTQSIAHSVFPRDPMATYAVAHDMTVYSSESGAIVFGTGTIGWGDGLDDYGPMPSYVSAAAQQITRNFLSRVLLTPIAPESLRLNATFSVRSQASGYPAANAGDGMTTTAWLAQAAPMPRNNNSWIQIDFGSRKHVDRVRWESINPGQAPYPGAGPSEYSLIVSDDGVRPRHRAMDQPRAMEL